MSAYMSMTEAARLFPSSKGDLPTHPSTVSRWLTTGVKVADNRFIRLEAIRFPSGWKVTREAIDVFLSRLTVVAPGEAEEPAQAPTSRTRQAELDRVDRELDAAGI